MNVQPARNPSSHGQDGYSKLRVLAPQEVAARVQDDQLLQLHGQARQKLRALARNGNMSAYAALVHRLENGHPVVPARHHREWCHVLQNPSQYPFVAIVAPPGAAKSSWGSIIYPAHRLGVTQGNSRIGIISSTATLAHGWASSVWHTLQTPEYRYCFPEVTIDFARGGARHSFYVTGAPQGANPSILASGIGGVSVLGKRFDEIVVDDPITWADARSSQTMNGIRHWLKTTLITRLLPPNRPPNGLGRILFLYTRWSEYDLTPTLRDLGFQIMTFPSLGYWDRTTRCPDCGWERTVTPCFNCQSDNMPEVVWGVDALWPESQSRESLERQRHDDELIFELVMQGNPKVLSGDTFNPDWFRRAPMPDLREFDSIVQAIDTAGGKDRMEGDYFAHVTLGSRGEEVWVLNVFRDRIPAPAQEAKIQELHDVFATAGRHPDLVVIEDANEGGAVYQHLEQESRMPLALQRPVGDKEFRAIPLSNAYRAQRMWHAETTVTGAQAKWLMPFEAEMLAFPDGKNDDMVDGATLAYSKLNEASPRIRVLG